MPRQRRYVVLLLTIHYFSWCFAQRNITIDDTDPSIAYKGSNWQVHQSQFDVNNTLQASASSDANASFTFTGVAVYYMSPLWSFSISAQVQLDNQPPVTVNLTDPDVPLINFEATVESAVVWSSGPIPNTTHTLTMIGGGFTMVVCCCRCNNVSFSDFMFTQLIDGIFSYTVLDPPPISSSSSSSSATGSSFATGSSSSPPSTTGGAALSTNTSSSNSSSSSSHVLPIVLGTVLGSFGLLIAAWLCSRRKKRPQSKAWTIAGNSLHESTPQGVDRVYTTDSWSTPNPQMSEVEVPLMAQPLPNPHDTSHNGHSQDFNPWIGLTDSVPYPRQQIPYGQQAPYPSNVTEKSAPAGTMNSSQLPLGSSPPSRPSVELGYYSPPPGTPWSGARLSYASDLPAGAAAAANLHQYPQPDPSSAAGSAIAGVSGAQPRKVKAEKNSSLIAVNKTDDEQDDLEPPAYSL